MSDSSTQKVNIEKKYCPICYQQFEGALSECPDDKAVLRGPANDPLIGKVFADRYEIQSVLGLGGMSIVYRAKHRLMDRIVAIKMLHSKLKEDVIALERFKLEAQAASSLNHQNIISVYDFGVTPDGEPFFVMDCLEGESLKELIDRKGKVPYQRALPVFRQICDGLDAAHRKQIVHRDLKPANVVLIKQEDGTELVKLVDFGIAKILSGKQAQHLTQTGEVFGSPIYMSPEQCLGKDLDTRSDIYALGCLMYETLAGVPPLVGDSFLQTMNMHVSDSPKPIQEVAPDAHVPPQLEQIIFHCVSKDPAKRIQTAGEIRDAISAVTHQLLGSSAKQGFVSGVAPATCAPAKKSPAMVILASILGFILVGSITFCALWPGPPEDRGTLLDKMRWQFAIAIATAATSRGDYAGAEQAAHRAEALARTFGDRQNKLETTLRLEADLYDKWEGHAQDLENVNNAIAVILLERAKNELDQRMKDLDALETKTNSGVAAAEMKLKAVAEIPGIITTAAKQHGKGAFDDEERLLTKALKVEKDLLEANDPSLAPLQERLADCLIQQRKFSRVRSLLVEAKELRTKDLKNHPMDYVRSLNRLGQYDLDQSDFKNSDPELAKALAEAKRLKVSKDLLLMCMRSYADLLRQSCRDAESKKLLREAEILDQGH